MPKAFSYLRFSSTEQSKGDSSRRQLALAAEYALRHGLDLDQGLTFHDLGVSAFTGRNARQGALGQFLLAVDEKLVEEGSYLLVESLDRVSRQSPWDALPVFQQIINAGVIIVTLQDGRRWSREEMRANPFRMFESILVMIRAHEESETKSRRLKAAWEKKRADATTKPISARAPGWLELLPDRTWMVLEDRAEVVRYVFNLTANGAGENLVAATLNREGVAPFGSGTRWHRTAVIRLLDNPAVAGTLLPYTLDHQDGRKVRTAQDAIPGYFPAVIDEETHATVRALRDGSVNPQRGRHAGNELKNVFGGLTRCPHCLGTMTRVMKGDAKKSGLPKLVCAKAKTGAGCRYRGVPLDQVEKALFDNVEAVLTSGGASADQTGFDGEMAAVRLDLEKLETKALGLAEAIALEPSSTTLRQALNNVEADIDASKSRLREIAALADASDGRLVQRYSRDLLAALEGAPDRAKANVALRKLFSEVVVDYYAGQLVLNWRNGRVTVIVYAAGEAGGDVPEEWRTKVSLIARRPLGQAIAPGVFVQENNFIDQFFRRS